MKNRLLGITLRGGLITVAFFLSATDIHAEDRRAIQVDWIEAPGNTCEELAKPTRLGSLKIVKPIFTSSEIESFSWQKQSVTLSAQATKRLFSNAGKFERESDDGIVPSGEFFDSKTGWFLLSIDGKPRLAGKIARSFEELRNPAACATLYPGIPNVQGGKMVLAFGKPRSRAELGEDFFKVLIEEGPSAAFENVLPQELKNDKRSLSARTPETAREK